MTKKPPKPLNVKELEGIKALRASGLSYHAISKEVNRDPKTVKKACLEPQAAGEIQVMRKELAGMFEGIAKRMIASISEEDIRKINAYQRTVSAGISIDKMRLLRDQSTDNIAVSAIIERLDREKRRKIGGERKIEREKKAEKTDG